MLKGLANAFRVKELRTKILITLGILAIYRLGAYLPVKVLGDGELTKSLTVKVDKVSASAKAKIEAAGGKVEAAC